MFAADYVAEPIAEAVQLNAPPKVDDSGLTLQGLITQEATYDSNPLLIVGGAKALYGSVTSPELLLKDSTPSSQINADTIVTANAFNQSSFNSVDVHSTAGIMTGDERWTVGLKEKTDYDTTRTSELSSFNLTTQPFRHTGFQLMPNVSYGPTAIDKISLEGTAATSEYQNKVFSNYNLYNITPTYVHNFDPMNAGVFAVEAQRYVTTDNRKITDDNIGPSIGWITALTPELMAKATVGGQTSQVSGSGIKSNSGKIDVIFSGDVTYKNDVDVLDFLASRAQYPLGDGTEGLLTTLSLADSHSINPNLALTLGAIYQSSKYQGGFAGNLQNQLGGNVGLVYRVTDKMDVTGNYSYRYETLSGVSGTAQEHLMTVALVYRLDAWSY